MKTGCLFTAQRRGRIAISLSLPPFLRDMPRYCQLAPPGWMNGRFEGDPAKWQRCFRKAVLDKLDAAEVWAELHELAGDDEPILCCWERLDGTKPGEWCHRTLVAEWLNEKLGHEVTEIPPKPKQTRQLDLFAV